MTEPVRNAEAFVRELITFRRAVKGSTPILHCGVATTSEQAAQDLAAARLAETAPQQEGTPE